MATTPAPDPDVEKALTQIMAKQSPLMKQARTQGLQAAQTAGLGQSTKGIQAAQAAAYQTALPIASQQAQQAQQTQMQREGFGHETGMQQAGFVQEKDIQQAGFGQQTKMQESQFGQERGMQQAQFGQERGMQAAEFQQATHQANLDRAHQKALQDQSAYLDRLKMHEGFTLEAAQETKMKALDRSMQERIASMEISAQDKERALSSITQFNNSYATAYGQIASNPDIPADARGVLLNQLDTTRANNYNMTTSLYRYAVPW